MITYKALTDGFSGSLHTPDSPGYESARQVWNGQIDRHPALIATCATTADVSLAVRYATSNNLRLSVRAGGHHVAGSAIVEAGVVVDLATMNGVSLSADHRRTIVQGGAKLGDLDNGTLPYGVITPAGIDADTGVGGLTLGGGVGWTMRQFGLTCDNLLAVTLVKADGSVERVSNESDPDLMWGLRGGGGNFGIVTEFEFAAHPIAEKVLAGFVIYSGDDAEQVLRGYREHASSAPNELTTIVFMRLAPAVPWIPPTAVGKPVVMIGLVYLGDLDSGEAIVAPFRELSKPLGDTVEPKSMAEHQAVLEGANPVGHRYYWKSAPIGDLTDDLLSLFDKHLHTISSPNSLLGFFQLGGAIMDHEDSGCFPNRDATFLVNYAVQWVDETEDDLHQTWTRAAMAEIDEHSLSGGYVNFLAEQGTDAVRAAYGDERFERLIALKNRMDTENVFSHNQNIPPST